MSNANTKRVDEFFTQMIKDFPQIDSEYIYSECEQAVELGVEDVSIIRNHLQAVVKYPFVIGDTVIVDDNYPIDKYRGVSGTVGTLITINGDKKDQLAQVFTKDIDENWNTVSFWFPIEYLTLIKRY